ncbi:MAG TPA: hypothetical protein VIZ00_12320, partial [Streptosporangiaceae bacterium]
MNSGVLLTVAIVVCVIALAALTALVLVIRRGASLLQGTAAAREAPARAEVPAELAETVEPEPAEARTAGIAPVVPA